MATLTFDQAVKEIEFFAKDSKIELYNPETNTTKEVALWKADIALVQNEGIIMVAGRKFSNNGNYAVEMR